MDVDEVFVFYTRAEKRVEVVVVNNRLLGGEKWTVVVNVHDSRPRGKCGADYDDYDGGGGRLWKRKGEQYVTSRDYPLAMRLKSGEVQLL